MWSQRDPSIRKSGIGNIFIKDLDPTVEHKELFETFSYFGNILSCKIATDEQGRSKGFGFVHFDSEESAERAIHEVNGKVIKSKQVYVAKFVSKRERIKLTDASWTNVFVKDLDPSITDEEFKKTFSQFGNITSAVISRDDDQQSKGFGFVNYEKHESATNAVNTMNGANFAGKIISCVRFLKRADRDAVLKKSMQQKKMDRITQLQGTNLYIKNIDDDIEEDRLRREFAPWGTIVSLKIMKDEKTNVSRGFGFISYSAPDEAKKAINEMNNRILQGCYKPLYVNLHEPKDVRRAKLEQQLHTRKIGPRVPAPAPYPVFYPPPNMPPYPVYPPQQMPSWPNPYHVPIPPPGKGPMGHPGVPAIRPPQPQGPPPAGNNNRGQKTPRNQQHQQHHQQDTNQHYESWERFQKNHPDENEQRDHIGNLLYNWVVKRDPKRAGKITGMLLESATLSELYAQLSDPQALKAKFSEAQRILDNLPPY